MCMYLSVSDSKWYFYSIPYDIKKTHPDLLLIATTPVHNNNLSLQLTIILGIDYSDS